MALVGQHDTGVEDSFSADDIWETVAEDAGDTPRTSRQSFRAPYDDKVPYCNSTNPPSVSGEHVRASGGDILRFMTGQDVRCPTPSLQPTNPNHAVAADDNPQLTAVSKPAQDCDGSGGGDTPELTAGKALPATNDPSPDPNVNNTDGSEMVIQHAEGDDLSSNELSDIRKSPQSSASPGLNSPQPTVALSHIATGEEAEAPPAGTPVAAHHGSLPTISPVGQAARLPGAHKAAVTRATSTFTETNDSPVGDMLELVEVALLLDSIGHLVLAESGVCSSSI